MSALVYPGLTTFSISKSDMAQMLYDALNHVRDERVKRGSLCKIRAKLIIRDSVAKFNSVRSSTLTL
jgi:DNA-binding LacI/PurR family transcriptional regulator